MFDPRNILSSVPIIGGLFDDSSEKEMDQLKKLEKLYKSDKSYYTAGYTPEQIAAQSVTEDPAMKEAQMGYLQKLMRLSDEGLSEVDTAAFDEARRQAEATAQRQQNAIINQMRERGIGGSGAELALRAQAAQSAANQAQASNVQQAADAARQRALYAQAYGSALGDVRNQDYRTQAANVDAANRIAQFNAQNVNQAAQYKANQMQEAADAKRSGLARVRSEYGDYYGAQGAERAKKRAALGSLAGSAIGGAVGGTAGAQTGAGVGGAIGDLF